MATEPWPWRQPPLPGETLTSCLVRNAYAHGDTPYRFFSHHWRGDPVWDRDFDGDPAALARNTRPAGAPDWLDDLAVSLGVTRRAVADATLAGWRERLRAGVGDSAGDTPLILSAGIHQCLRTRHALQFCPDCLAEGRPHFRKAWRLGFAVFCDRHARPLLDGCAWCGAAVAPHRSKTFRMQDCHACERPVAGRHGGVAGFVPDRAVSLQGRLLAALAGQDDGEVGPLGAGEALATVRALLGASAPRAAHAAIREALGLGPSPGDGPERRRFEHCRQAVRAPWLETVATWVDDWPRNFLVGADAMGASRRTFARCRVPPALAAQVERLPARRRRRRKPWEPLLDEPVLRKLRRTDRTAYSRVRAERILAHCGTSG